VNAPGIRLQVCRRTASAALLVSALLPISLTAASASPATVGTTEVTAVNARTTTAGPTSPLSVSLTSVTPTVATARTQITITGSVRNSGSVPLVLPVARAFIGQTPLTSRQSVSDWASSTSEQPLTEVARSSLGKTLAAGSLAAFTLKIPATAISHRDAFAVLPLRVEVAATTATSASRSGDVHTFLPTLASVKAFEPLSIAWLVPLTLDPDPTLHGESSAARTAAWTRAIGPGSRLDRLIQGTENASVTWAIDPAILGPPQTTPSVDTTATPSQTPGATTSPRAGSNPTPDPVIAQTTALGARLKAAASRHTLWALPYADPDLAALLPLASGNQVLTSLIGRPTGLEAAVGTARTDIAWPVEGALTAQSEAQLRRAFATPGLAAAVTSSSTLPSRDVSADASRKSGKGLPLLAYDASLSRTVAQTSSKASGAITIQRFLADSMALLGERPGTRHRSVLIAEPRGFAGDPTVLRSLFAAVAKAPWLVPTTTEQLLADSKKMAPESSGAGASGTPTSPPATATGTRPAPDPMSPGASPLTPSQLAAMPGTQSSIAGIASILGDGGAFAARWSDAQVQELSARWRGHPEGYNAVGNATSEAISKVSRNVRVAPSSVNFFADRGVLQVTVVNDLAVPVHDVHLTLNPAQPRLRIEQQPGPMKVGARSRSNARLQVTSLAAGLVNVEAILTTRNGTPLGQNTSVDVRVQPPSPWIYWVLGGLAGLILVLGTYRSLRRGSTRGSRPDAQELPLNERVLND
jgi:Family of unknown function (DUF6049)